MPSEFEAAVVEVARAASESRRAWGALSARASAIRSNCLSAFNKNMYQAENQADRSLLRVAERARVSSDMFLGLCDGAHSHASEIESRSEIALKAVRSGNADQAALARITLPLDQWHACLRDEGSGGVAVSGRHAPGLAPRTFRDARSLKASCSAKPAEGDWSTRVPEAGDPSVRDPLIQSLKYDHRVVCGWLSCSPAHDPVFSELIKLESALYELIAVLAHQTGLRVMLAAMEAYNVDPAIKPHTGILDMEILRAKHYLGIEIAEAGTEEE